ncbi:BA75_02465T0 [Komagataella pastoris]|uniref:BA75_02465T0 n=1 Tax=Komagataella pastoris TaxID=4922 RepID=A0A1B2JCJ1_PICPA|nr:BA75_02465T0 [Komagataella pastoris]
MDRPSYQHVPSPTGWNDLPPALASTNRPKQKRKRYVTPNHLDQVDVSTVNQHIEQIATMKDIQDKEVLKSLQSLIDRLGQLTPHELQIVDKVCVDVIEGREISKKEVEQPWYKDLIAVAEHSSI